MRAFRLVLAVVIAVLVLRAAPAHATHSVPVIALEIDRRTPTTLYAGTDGGGGVFKSTDGGDSWSVSGLAYIDALVIDPLTPTTLHAGIESWGTYKSTDGGATWNSTGLGVVSSLVIDPLTPTTLYAGTLGQELTYPHELSEGAGGVYKSTDGGANWSAVVRFYTTNGWYGAYCYPCGGVSALAIDPQTPTTIYGHMESITVYDEWGDISWSAPSQVIKSTDGGLNWNAVGLTDVGVLVLAIDPLTPATLYAGTNGGVYKSTDRGATWNTSGDLAGTVSSLAIDPLTPAIIYAGVYDAIQKSTDGAASWSVTGLPGVGLVHSLAIDPLTPTTLYAGTSYDGVFKSANSGVSWNRTGVITWTHIASMSANPSSVVRGSSSVVTVTLSAPAPTGGAMVLLYSPYVAVPASVTVAEGATSADFTISTSLSTEGTVPAWIYASYGGSGCSTMLTLTPASASVSSLSFNPTTVPGGAGSIGTVTLNVAAPAGGTMIGLSSSNPAVATVPASVTVAAGATSANFTVSTSLVTTSTPVTMQAANFSAVLNVIPATTLSSLALNPATVIAGNSSSGTVTLSAPAPAGGAVVALSSSNAVATVPTSVTVAAGVTSTAFTVSTSSLTACAPVVATISAAYGGVTRSAGLTVTPATDTVAIQQADYFADRHELRVAATSTGSTATLQAYVTTTGALVGTLKHYDGNRYSGRFTWPVNPQNITVRSSRCGSAMSAVRSR